MSWGADRFGFCRRYRNVDRIPESDLVILFFAWGYHKVRRAALLYWALFLSAPLETRMTDAELFPRVPGDPLLQAQGSWHLCQEAMRSTSGESHGSSKSGFQEGSS